MQPHILQDNSCQETWEYRAVSENCSHPELGAYETYSLEVYRKNDGNGGPLCRVRDVSTKRHVVQAMADCFNRLQLSPVHLLDAVRDMLP